MIILIASVSENNVIGNKGNLPWHISDDLKRFKQLTLNHPVIMGRKTFESILKVFGKPLPGRTNIVVTRDKNYQSPGCIIKNSIEEGIKEAKKLDKDIYIIGGQNIYEQSIDFADRLEITKIHKNYEGDAFFPKIGKEWKETKREDKDGFSFITYQRS